MKTNPTETTGLMPRPSPISAVKSPLDHDGSLPTAPRSSLKWTITAGVLVVLSLVGWVIYRRATPIPVPIARAAGGRGPAGPVPVVEGRVLTKDVPIYLDGLGTVQAFNTVTLHSRVDGQLIKVAFNEGQDVKAGDVL